MVSIRHYVRHIASMISVAVPSRAVTGRLPTSEVRKYGSDNQSIPQTSQLA